MQVQGHRKPDSSFTAEVERPHDKCGPPNASLHVSCSVQVDAVKPAHEDNCQDSPLAAGSVIAAGTPDRVLPPLLGLV